MLYTPRWTREVYFASDEGASKIIVESSPRGIKPLYARLIPGFIFILWHFTFVQSARVAFAGTEPVGYKYENFLLCLITFISSTINNEKERIALKAVIVYCYVILLFNTKRRKIYSNRKQQTRQTFVATFHGESKQRVFLQSKPKQMKQNVVCE